VQEKPVVSRTALPPELTSPGDIDRHVASTVASGEPIYELDRDRIRACAGHDCVLHFYDASRAGRRQWCSMAGCGNRAKARRHYERSRLRA
jgi:predicted RNA-binding Zn ribbon-like protein